MSSMRIILGLLALIPLAGCQSGPLGSLAWSPFARKERTTYQTPGVRMQEALAIGKNSTGKDTPEQQQLVGDLARQIQSEPDPLVREAIVKSVAQFQTPLAAQVLRAGLNDTEPLVRRRCCQLIGERSDPQQAVALAEVVKSDNDLDVRIEAVRALGHIQSPETTAALVKALESEDPAVQFAGVESMKKVTGKDFGGDVRAYLAYAKGETPAGIQEDQSSVASRLRRFSPF